MTEWNAFRALYLARVMALLREPVLVDLRIVYRPDELRRHDLSYTGIRRSNMRKQRDHTSNFYV